MVTLYLRVSSALDLLAERSNFQHRNDPAGSFTTEYGLTTEYRDKVQQKHTPVQLLFFINVCRLLVSFHDLRRQAAYPLCFRFLLYGRPLGAFFISTGSANLQQSQ